jgi:hypothetical protein
MQHQFEETSEDVQALFRQVNERVLEVNRVLGPTARLVDFVCECRDPACTERLTLSVAQYEAIRRHRNRHIVHPGHHAPTRERTTQITRGYAVIERDEDLVVAEPQAAA